MANVTFDVATSDGGAEQTQRQQHKKDARHSNSLQRGHCWAEKLAGDRDRRCGVDTGLSVATSEGSAEEAQRQQHKKNALHNRLLARDGHLNDSGEIRSNCRAGSHARRGKEV